MQSFVVTGFVVVIGFLNDVERTQKKSRIGSNSLLMIARFCFFANFEQPHRALVLAYQQVAQMAAQPRKEMLPVETRVDDLIQHQ